MTDPDTGEKISFKTYMAGVFPTDALVCFQFFLICNKLLTPRLFGYMPWWQILVPTLVSMLFCIIWPVRQSK